MAPRKMFVDQHCQRPTCMSLVGTVAAWTRVGSVAASRDLVACELTAQDALCSNRPRSIANLSRRSCHFNTRVALGSICCRRPF